MDLLMNFLKILIVFNTLLAIITVFRKSRPVTDTWAWLLILVFFPIGGFVLYLFTGRGLGEKTNSRIDAIEAEGREKFNAITKDSADFTHNADQNDVNSTQRLFYNLVKQPIAHNNSIKIFTSGKEKFAALFNDIKNAKQSIYIEYYSFYMDGLGKELLSLLEEKAAAGLLVRVIYDGMGSAGTKIKHFDKLISLGGDATSYITSRDSMVKFRLNYHLHRKIAVIDNEIAYNGGFNIGDQYLGKDKTLGNWRDTHLRILGPGALSLGLIFVQDWNISVTADRAIAFERIFDQPQQQLSNAGAVQLQVVSSGPSSDKEAIKSGYIKMINSAKKYVWIQTPYFVPDEAVVSALKIAAASGVDVRVMIPDKPDNPFVYRATQYHAKNLFNSGITIYNYDNGFIHAKTIVVDDCIASVGSANQDVRSYKLNFEVNTFLYDAEVARNLKAIYLEDIKVSTELTQEIIDDYSWWLKFKQSFSRLLSPIL